MKRRIQVKRASVPRSAKTLNDSEGLSQNLILGPLVRDLYKEYQKGLQRELQPMDISLPQWIFLRILWREEGLTQKELSLRVGQHQSTTVDTLRIMEQAGLILRRPDPKDGRAVRVDLSRKGRDLEPVLMQSAMDLNDRALDGFSRNEIAVLCRLLKRAQRNLENAAR